MEEVPPEENTVTYLNRAMSDAELLTKELEPIWISIDEQESTLREERGDDEKVEIFPTDAELEKFEAAFTAYPKVIPLLQQAANCPGYYVDYQEKLRQNQVDQETAFDMSTNDTCRRSVADPIAKGTLLDAIGKDAQKARMFARLFVSGRFPLLMAKEQYDQAVQDSIVVLKLARLSSKEPAMVHFLVRSALRYMAIERINRVLQSQQVSDKVRQELEEELAKADVRHDHLYSLKTERAFNVSCFDESFGCMPWYSRTFWNWQQVGTLDVVNWAIARATAALPENSTAGSVNRHEEDPPSCGVLGQLLIPSLEATEEVANRSEAQIRALRVLNALGQRDNPEKESLANLSDLGLPESATIDPYSGKPLIVKKVEGGWLIYSVGENRIDDGGDLNEKKRLDIGLQPVVQIQSAPVEKEEE